MRFANRKHWCWWSW